jgi:hypothetical protein
VSGQLNTFSGFSDSSVQEKLLQQHKKPICTKTTATLSRRCFKIIGSLGTVLSTLTWGP